MAVEDKKQTKIEKKKNPFYKGRGWKIFFSFLAVVFVVGVSFLAYIFATGSKVFDGGLKGDGSLLHALTREDLQNDNGRTNILIIGRGGENHPGGLLTDSLMLASIQDGKLSLLSIPRDLQVPIENHGKAKINEAFADGYNDYMLKSCSKKKVTSTECVDGALSAGANLSKNTVSTILDTPIHYYVMADFEGFKKLINEIGGVDVYVEKAIYDPFYPDKNMTGYEPLRIKAGQQHMDGDLALKYSRSRETTSDFDRAARQQIVLSAVKDKVMQAGFLANPKKIIDLVNIMGDHVRTDFAPTEIKTLADLIGKVDKSNITKKVLSSGPDGLLVDDSSTGIYYLVPRAGNFSQIQRYAANIFETQILTPKEENAKIEIQNGTATSGLAGKMATELKKDDLNISSIVTSKEKYKKTTIYDYTKGGKKQTVALLKEELGASVIEKDRPEGSNIDISVIIGDDYITKTP